MIRFTLDGGSGRWMNGAVELWDTVGKKVLRAWKEDTKYPKAVLTPDGKVLAIASDTTVKIWDVATLRAK